MPPFFWLAACIYLVVGAVSALEAEIICHRAGASASIQACVLTLVFAAAWPLRAVAQAFRRPR